MAWLYLILAILAEVVGTVSMKLSYGFTKLIPSISMFVFYILAFVLLSFSLKSIPVSTAYAIWSAVGTAAIAVIGYFVFKENLSLTKIIALLLIIVGVVMLNLSEQSSETEQVQEIHSQNKMGL